MTLIHERIDEVQIVAPNQPAGTVADRRIESPAGDSGPAKRHVSAERSFARLQSARILAELTNDQNAVQGLEIRDNPCRKRTLNRGLIVPPK